MLSPRPPRRTCCSRCASWPRSWRARQGRPLLLIDLAVPRDIDASCAEIDGVSLFDIDDLQARDRPQPPGAPGRGAQGRGDHRAGDPALRARGWGRSRCSRPWPRCACTPPRSPRRSCTRTPASGSRHRRAIWSGSTRIAHAIVNRLLHHPTARMRELHDDRVHARMALIRDLFGLRSRARTARSASASAEEPLAEVRELRRAATLIRIGTRGSALALAQASWVAERLGRGVELVDHDAGDRGAPVGDKSRWVSELERALLDGRDRRRRALGQGRPGRAARRTGAGGDPARARPARRDLRRRRPRRPGAGRARGDEQPAARGPAPGAARRPRGASSCAGTSTRGCASSARESGRARARRGGSAAPGRAAARPTALLDEFVPAAGQGALALEARVRRIEPGAGRGWSTPRRRRACTPSARSSHALGASCNTPVGAYARVGAPGELELHGVGRPSRRLGLDPRRVPGGAESLGAVRRADAGRGRRRAAAPRPRRCWRRDRLPRRRRPGRSRPDDGAGARADRRGRRDRLRPPDPAGRARRRARRRGADLRRQGGRRPVGAPGRDRRAAGASTARPGARWCG